MLPPDAELREFSDDVLRIVLPGYHTLQRGMIGQGKNLEIGYYSTVNVKKGIARSESVFIEVRAPSSPLAAQLRSVLLSPPRLLTPPQTTVLSGPSDVIPGAAQCITFSQARRYCQIQLSIPWTQAEVMLRIFINGEASECQPRWNDVMRSLHLVEGFCFERWQDSAHTVAAPQPQACQKLPDGFRVVLDSLPSELVFLQPALVNLGEQAVDHAEDADLSQLLAVVKQELKAKRLAVDAALGSWFQAYDRWWKERRDSAEPELGAFSVVHGALLGFSLYGIED